MDIMINLVLGIASSIIASIILFFIATLASRKARWIFTAVASAFLKIDVKYVFKDSRDAEKTIQEALDRATSVKIFTSRGNQFQRDAYSTLLQKNTPRKRTIHILLPNPNNSFSTTDWIDQREKEIVTVGKAYRNGFLRQQIKNSIEYLSAYSVPGEFELRMYNAPHLARIILTENYLFLQPYKEGIEGRDCPVIQYGRGDMYDTFYRFFCMIWDTSEPVQ